MTDLERAIAFATEAHAGQTDKLGQPYIDHCLRVMDAVSEPAKRVAVLHDVAEDSEWVPLRIMDHLALSTDEAVALVLLDRAKGHTYQQYISEIAENRSGGGDLAREVKVADLRDNLGRWVPELGTDLKARYERALARLTNGETTT